MANTLATSDPRLRPLICYLPDTADDLSGRWRRQWDSIHGGFFGVDLTASDAPHRDFLIERLNTEFHRIDRPVVLIAHGIGCMPLAWWAEYGDPASIERIIGALLIEPPDVDRPGRHPWLSRFGACSRTPLPFPSFVVASSDDPRSPIRTAMSLAADWGSSFACAGHKGRLNPQRDGDRKLLEWLLDRLLLNETGSGDTAEPSRATFTRQHQDRPEVARADWPDPSTGIKKEHDTSYQRTVARRARPGRIPRQWSSPRSQSSARVVHSPGAVAEI